MIKDKVMKSIECCLRPGNTNLCGECSYKDVPFDCKHALIKDVHELLKEQEAVSVVQREFMHLLFWCCGSCGVAITHGDKFCRNCGKAVKWK